MGILFDKPADRNITLYQGATFRECSTINSGNPADDLDPAGGSVVAEVWASYDDTAPLVRWNTDTGDATTTEGSSALLEGVVVDGRTVPRITLELSDDATALLPRLDKPAHWYCALTWGDGDTTWTLEGKAIIAQKKERTPCLPSL